MRKKIIAGITCAMLMGAMALPVSAEETPITATVGSSYELTIPASTNIVYNATTPKRGDVIVFKPKGNENDHYYIKRIVGLPGETIEIIENRVYIDGERLEEDYETTNIDDVGVVDEKLKLAGDEYFVLGDNREQSEDSRDADVGNVKREYIYGKAWFVITPGDEFGFVN